MRANETGILKLRCLYFVQKSAVRFGYRNRGRCFPFSCPFNVNADGIGGIVSRFVASHGFVTIQPAQASAPTQRSAAFRGGELRRLRSCSYARPSVDGCRLRCGGVAEHHARFAANLRLLRRGGGRRENSRREDSIFGIAETGNWR